METGNVSTGAEGLGGEVQSNESDQGQESLDNLGSEQQGTDRGSASQGNARQDSSTEQQMKELSDDYMDHMVKLKVNGKEVKKPLRDVIKLQQLEAASHEKMQKSAEVETKYKTAMQRVNQLGELMKTDFPKFAKLMQIDLDKISTDHLARKYDLETMTPEQRELHELREKSKQHEETAKQRETREKQERETRTNRMAAQSLDKEIGEALKTGGLPKSPYYVQRMAAKMVTSLERVKAGLDESPLQAGEALAKVKEDWHSELKGSLETMDAKAICEMLGPEILKKIRTFEVQRVTGQKVFENRRESSPDNQSASGKQVPEHMNEFERRKYIADLRNDLK